MTHPKNGVDRYKGVRRSSNGNGFEASTFHDGASVFLGRYPDEISAAQAFDQAAICLEVSLARRYHKDVPFLVGLSIPTTQPLLTMPFHVYWALNPHQPTLLFCIHCI